MSEPPFKPEFIGDPARVEHDAAMAPEDKIAILSIWRDRLTATDADGDHSMDSGDAARLMEIERTLVRLRAG